MNDSDVADALMNGLSSRILSSRYAATGAAPGLTLDRLQRRTGPGDRKGHAVRVQVRVQRCLLQVLDASSRCLREAASLDGFAARCLYLHLSNRDF